jgi:N-dimethylarginine dimethylaminohydrolase
MWFVKARYHTLRIAIVEPGGLERWWALPVGGEYPLAWGSVDLPYHTTFTKWESEQQRRDIKYVQYKAVKDELPDVRLLELRQLLQETLDAWRDDKNRLKEVILRCFHEWDRPRVERLLGSRYENVTAGQIFGEEPPLLKDGEGWKVGIRPLTWVNNISEGGWMTDKGFIYCNKKEWWRSREDEVMHAVMENHPELMEKVHILGDLKAPAYMEGGDMRSPSEDTIMAGVGWHTNREAMIEISKMLPEKTVYVVQKVRLTDEDLTGFVTSFGWHFESFFCEVDEGKALVAPYISNYPVGSRELLIKWFKILKRDIEDWHPLLRKLREEGISISTEQRKRIMETALQDLTDEKIATLKDVGSVEIYKNGELTSRRDSFIETLIEDGVLDPDGIMWYGGNPDDYANPLEYMSNLARNTEVECAECLKPGVVLIYDGCEGTIRELKDHGCRAVTYKAFHQKKFGGPCQDCSFLPLHRES